MRSYSDLPQELIVDILSRLPAKSAGQCRCVSKLWLALLTRPEFIKTHLQLALITGEESLIFTSGLRCSPSSLFYSPLSSAHHLFDEITLSLTQLIFVDHCNSWRQVHGSCDGLLLVGDYLENTFVLNPITREIRQVPHSPNSILDSYEGGVNEMCGFGYDSVSNDYKIVTISWCNPRFDDDDDEIEPDCTDMFVNVYSLKSGSWKMVDSSPYDFSNSYELDSGVFLHGCIHFLGSVTDYSTTKNYKYVIVAFDLVEEKFHEVPPPPNSIIETKFIYTQLAQLGGCLCLFDRYKDSDVWELWMMKDYGVAESWMEFRILDPEVMEVWPVYLLEQEYLVVSKHGHKKLGVYNLKQGIVEDIVVHGMIEDLHVKESFVESLISPHAWW